MDFFDGFSWKVKKVSQVPLLKDKATGTLCRFYKVAPEQLISPPHAGDIGFNYSKVLKYWDT